MDVSVRFIEKDATVRYVPGKTTLAQILRRYEDTPFEVAPESPVVTITRRDRVTFRAWITTAKEGKKGEPPSIQVLVDAVPNGSSKFAAPPELTLADPPAPSVALTARPGVLAPVAGSDPPRLGALLAPAVKPMPEEFTVPVAFRIGTIGAEGDKREDKGRFDLVVRTPKPEPVADAGTEGAGAARIGGALDLRLAHLCDQKGCVDHFHSAVRPFKGVAAVRPRPHRKTPRATAYLRHHRAVDVWSLRESLRSESIEVTGMVPEDLDAYRLWIELPRWTRSGDAPEVRHCMDCREELVTALRQVGWAGNSRIVGGGIGLRPTRSDADLAELLDAVEKSGRTPRSVWLIPEGVPMPKAGEPLVAGSSVPARRGGSEAHPIVEVDVVHACDAGTDVASLIHGQKWASRTGVRPGTPLLASASIEDRKFANLTTLADGMRRNGHAPGSIRLRGFGDVRIQIDFAHICGPVVFSKPPKPKKKDPKKKDDPKAEKKPPAPKKPFVPKPLRPDPSSNGARAILDAVSSVDWIKNATFSKHHTPPKFSRPRQLFATFETKGEDVVTVDPLVEALRDAGFPPQSVIVSRLFAGIPFGKSLPRDLEVADLDGKNRPLAAFKKKGRPLAVAFVSLDSPKIKKKTYKAEPDHYRDFARTVEKFGGQVDFVAVSANKKDSFKEVADFWVKTGVSAPLYHDAGGAVKAVFNAQITPAPHLFVFDAEGRLRYGGDPHDNWGDLEKSKDDYLARALELVLAGKYKKNGAVFYNRPVCNCSHPKCSCPKCGCGSTCRCASKKCGVGFGTTK